MGRKDMSKRASSETGTSKIFRLAYERNRKGSAGFTLVELLVVLVILGLLFGLVGPRVLGYLSSAKSDVAKLQIKQLSASLDMYLLDVGRYPTQEEGLRSLVEQPSGATRWNGPYLAENELPLDPWNNHYQYRFPGQNRPYDLLSLGADSALGGEGENSDITN